MFKRLCPKNKTEEASNVSVKVTVDVTKIVRYLSVAGVLIVGIIFGTKTFQSMLENDFFEIEG